MSLSKKCAWHTNASAALLAFPFDLSYSLSCTAPGACHTLWKAMKELSDRQTSSILLQEGAGGLINGKHLVYRDSREQVAF